GHQEVARPARAIAREHASGPVAAMRGRRQAQDQDTRERIAHARNGPAPVLLVPIRGPLHACHLAAVGAQPRALLAVDDARADGVEGGGSTVEAGGLSCHVSVMQQVTSAVPPALLPFAVGGQYNE